MLNTDWKKFEKLETNNLGILLSEKIHMIKHNYELVGD